MGFLIRTTMGSFNEGSLWGVSWVSGFRGLGSLFTRFLQVFVGGLGVQP